jgi:hypothetical protein
MSASEDQDRSSRRQWRAPVIGAVTGLAVAAAIVVPSAIAAGGQGSGSCAAAKSTRAGAASGTPAGKPAPPPPDSVPHQFLDVIAQLQQDGTISAAQAHTLAAAVASGSIDPEKMVADHVVTAAQMNAVSDRLKAVKESLASQMQSSSSESGSAKGG